MFPCGHLFHGDCLVTRVMKLSSGRGRKRIEKLKGEELEVVVAGECPLCGDLMVRGVDEPFVGIDEGREVELWAI